MSTEQTTTETEPRRESRGGRVLRFAIAIIFGLFFAYILFGALSNLIQLPSDLSGTELVVPWWLLILGVVMPPLLYAGAFLLTRRRELFAQVLIWAVTLATAYALSLSINTLGSYLIASQL